MRHLPHVLTLLLGLSTIGCGASPEFREEIIETDVETYVPVATMTSLLGRWKGTGAQNDGTSWDMVLDITSHRTGKCANIHYPSSGCSGYWECISDFNGAQLEAVEHITEGRDKCVDEVDVEIVVDKGGTISFYAATGDITAEGRLSRR